jgi:hypothetical protein
MLLLLHTPFRHLKRNTQKETLFTKGFGLISSFIQILSCQGCAQAHPEKGCLDRIKFDNKMVHAAYGYKRHAKPVNDGENIKWMENILLLMIVFILSVV